MLTEIAAFFKVTERQFCNQDALITARWTTRSFTQIKGKTKAGITVGAGDIISLQGWRHGARVFLWMGVWERRSQWSDPYRGPCGRDKSARGRSQI